jgi:hypothetical protein
MLTPHLSESATGLQEVPQFTGAVRNVPKKKACLSNKEEETHETAKATDLDVQVPSSGTGGEPTGAAPMEAASENGTRGAHYERSSESNYAMLRALISKIGNDRAEERDVALTSEERTSHYGGVSASGI